jgi:hypothetical protein
VNSPSDAVVRCSGCFVWDNYKGPDKTVGQWLDGIDRWMLCLSPQRAECVRRLLMSKPRDAHVVLSDDG